MAEAGRRRLEPHVCEFLWPYAASNDPLHALQLIIVIVIISADSWSRKDRAYFVAASYHFTLNLLLYTCTPPVLDARQAGANISRQRTIKQVSCVHCLAYTSIDT
jgi:hypothetical protein